MHKESDDSAASCCSSMILGGEICDPYVRIILSLPGCYHPINVIPVCIR